MAENRACQTFLLFFCLMAALKQISAAAQDWPQWRGPSRDGVVSALPGPQTWPERLKLKWKVVVGSGHSSPVVAGRKIYLHSRREEQEIVSCLVLETGRIVWQQGYSAPYRMNPAAMAHGKGPKSTPVVRDGKLYTLGIGGILSCFNSETGRLVWRKDFIGQFKETSPLYGVAMSPLIDNNVLIAHVGGHDQGALTAFDVKTGDIRWSWNGDGPAYASPIVIELHGTRQVVTQTQKYLVGVSVASGELLWSIPFTTEYVQNIVTPVLYQQMLIFSGLFKGTMAVKVFKRGSEWSTEKVWHNPEVSMYMNSAVLAGDLLFGLSHRNKGQFFCLDPRDGSTLWTSAGRQGENAAMVVLGEVLLVLTSDAELIVVGKSAKGFEPLRRYSVAESPTWTHPVVVGHRVLIKDASSLALWSLK